MPQHKTSSARSSRELSPGPGPDGIGFDAPGKGKPTVQRKGQRSVSLTKGGQSIGGADVHDHGDAAKLYNLQVNSSHRGNGGGSELLRTAAKEAANMGKRKLVLESEDRGTGKLDKWYESNGFTNKGKGSRGMSEMEVDVSSLLQRKSKPNLQGKDGI